MSKNNDVVSVVISTRKIDDEFLAHVEKMFSHPQTEILIYENECIWAPIVPPGGERIKFWIREAGRLYGWFGIWNMVLPQR